MYFCSPTSCTTQGGTRAALELEGTWEGVPRAVATAVTGSWKAVAVAGLAVAEWLGGHGARTDAVGAELTVIHKRPLHCVGTAAAAEGNRSHPPSSTPLLQHRHRVPLGWRGEVVNVFQQPPPPPPHQQRHGKATDTTPGVAWTRGCWRMGAAKRSGVGPPLGSRCACLPRPDSPVSSILEAPTRDGCLLQPALRKKLRPTAVAITDSGCNNRQRFHWTWQLEERRYFAGSSVGSHMFAQVRGPHSPTHGSTQRGRAVGGGRGGGAWHMARHLHADSDRRRRRCTTPLLCPKMACPAAALVQQRVRFVAPGGTGASHVVVGIAPGTTCSDAGRDPAGVTTPSCPGAWKRCAVIAWGVGGGARLFF